MVENRVVCGGPVSDHEFPRVRTNVYDSLLHSLIALDPITTTSTHLTWIPTVIPLNNRSTWATPQNGPKGHKYKGGCNGFLLGELL